MMIDGTVQGERAGRLRKSSYSIYLVHYFAFSLFLKLALGTDVDQMLPPAAMFVLLYVVASASEILVCHCVEWPLLRQLRPVRWVAAAAAPAARRIT